MTKNFAEADAHPPTCLGTAPHSRLAKHVFAAVLKMPQAAVILDAHVPQEHEYSQAQAL